MPNSTNGHITWLRRKEIDYVDIKSCIESLADSSRIRLIRMKEMDIGTLWDKIVLERVAGDSKVVRVENVRITSNDIPYLVRLVLSLPIPEKISDELIRRYGPAKLFHSRAEEYARVLGFSTYYPLSMLQTIDTKVSVVSGDIYYFNPDILEDIKVKAKKIA